MAFYPFCQCLRDGQKLSCKQDRTHLVSLMGSSSGNLALVARGEFGEITVVVTLPIVESISSTDKVHLGDIGAYIL